MKEDSSEKSAAARSTGDIVIQKDGRLLRAECVCRCVCVCIYIYTLLCRNERGRGQESQTLSERESLHGCCLYVCELVADLLPLAEVLEQRAKMNLFSSYFSRKVGFEPGIEFWITI